MSGGNFNHESETCERGTAHRSCVSSKKFTFSQQIEKFPLHLRRSTYVSPMNNSKGTDCDWAVVIDAVRESQYSSDSSKYNKPGSYRDCIVMSLRRNNYKKEYQSIDVRLTVIDSFGIRPLYASKEIHFTPSLNEEIVLCVTKSELFDGYCGLNKVRFMPDDILTVKCEITAYEIVEKSYASEFKLEDMTEYGKVLLKYIVFGILIALASHIYIYFKFVLPKISVLVTPLKELPDHLLAFLFYTSGIYMLIRYLLKPGTDNTYHKSEKYLYTQRIQI